MDYSYLQGFGLDGPLAEERNLFISTSGHGFFHHPDYNPSFPSIWRPIPDPALLQLNEHAWLNKVQIPLADNVGVDASGHSTHQRPNTVMQNSHMNIPADMMMSAISSDSFQFGGDAAAHAQWTQMCSLSSDEYLNDAMPQLISESTAQRPCIYTSSSECLHEAESSGSSERDRPLSRSCLVGSPSDEINWRNSDVLQGNLGGSMIGFPLDLISNDSSSVGADLDNLDSSGNTLSSLVSMPGPSIDCVTPLGRESWMAPSTIQSIDRSKVTSILHQHNLNLDPFGASFSTHYNGAPPCERQRPSYTMENRSTNPLSMQVNPSVSKTILTRSSRSDYPMTSLNIADALSKHFHISRGETMSLPKPLGFEALGKFATNRDRLGDDSKSHRKQNATSIEPQSVAARHRRKKISERVRVLEKLIPGGDKMDTASMLDESIDYVKFLQLQVRLLESLRDLSDGISETSAPSLAIDNIGGETKGLDRRTSRFASKASQSCMTMQQVRPAASPLILSEILQRQLFKHKLCLVSLLQCPSSASPTSTSGAYS